MTELLYYYDDLETVTGELVADIELYSTDPATPYNQN